MNWTGGCLSRHSATAGALKNRQKQHFAKVQTSLRSGPKKTSPLKWSILDQIAKGKTNPSQHSSTSHRAATNEQSVQRAEELKLSSRSNELPQNPQPSSSYVKREPSNVSEDLYNATPPPRRPKRQREISVPELEVGYSDEELVAEKRLRLLRMGDWVGITIQKPLQLVFTSPTQAARVGKRRRISGGHRAVYNKRQSQVTSALVSTRSLHRATLYPDTPQILPLGRSDVRISIGGRQIQPGISSSSRASKFRHPSTHSYLSNRSHRTSLDVMLLDGEELLHRPVINPDVKYDHVIMKDDGFYGDRYPTMLESRPRAAKGKNENQASIHRLWGTHGVPDRGYLSENTESHNSNTAASPREPVLSSSSALIYQPTPVKLQVPKVLRSSSSDIADSTAAHLGQPRPCVPSSQVLANDVWKSWMAALDDGGRQSSAIDQDNVGGLRQTESSISPGISTAPVTRHARQQHLRENDSQTNGSQQPALLLKGAEKFKETADVRESWMEMQQAGLKDWRGRNRTILSKHKSRTTTHESQRHICTVERTDPQLLFDIPANANILKAPDTDNLWRKFVFGSSSDGNDVRGQEREPTPGKRTFTSSVVYDPEERVSSPAIRARSESWYNDFVSADYSSMAGENSASENEEMDVQKPPENYTGCGLVAKSSLAMGLDSGTAYVVANPSHEFVEAMSRISSFSSEPPKQSITFTKPIPFVGGEASGIRIQEGSRRRAREADLGCQLPLPKRYRERDVYSIVSSEEMSEVESSKDYELASGSVICRQEGFWKSYT